MADDLSGQARQHLPGLVAVLIASFGYLDPGNWAACAEAGARFGFELVWIVVLAGFVSGLEHYLSARLVAATGRHLAQACRDEYPSAAYRLLWFSALVSHLCLDSAAIIGTAIGLSLLVGFPLYLGVILVATSFAVLNAMGHSAAVLEEAQVALSGVTGLLLLLFVLNAVFGRSTLSPVAVPRLRPESGYAAAALLGSSVLPHLNMFDRSRIFSDIVAVLITSSVFNLAMMLVAAAAVHTTGLLSSLQDGFFLIESLAGNAGATVAFAFTLLCAGLLSFLTRVRKVSTGSLQLQYAARATAVVLASLYASSYGSEGIYQVLLLSKAILAFQLPFPLVLLIRLTSSVEYMGEHKISSLTVGVSVVVVLLLIVLNVWALLGPLFIDADEWGFVAASGLPWLNSETILALITVSMGALLWLAFSPMNADMIVLRPQVPAFEREAEQGKEAMMLELTLEGELILQQTTEELAGTAGGTGTGTGTGAGTGTGGTEEVQETDLADCEVFLQKGELNLKDDLKDKETGLVTTEVVEEQQALEGEEAVEVASVISEATHSSCDAAEVHAVSDDGSAIDAGKLTEAGKDADIEKDSLDKEEESWENLEPVEVGSSAYEGPESAQSMRTETESGSGSSSRLSGLGRATRRQLAAVLDEFWGKLFDLHGQPVGQSTSAPASRAISGTTQQDGDGPFSYPRPATAGRGQRNPFQLCPTPSDGYGRTYSHFSASTSQGYGWSAEVPGSPSFADSFGERRYSSMRYNTHPADLEYQPATVHGYNVASHTNRTGSMSSPRARPLHLDVHALRSRTPSELGYQTGYPQYGANFEAEQSVRSTPRYASFMGGAADSLPSQLGHKADRDYEQWEPRSSGAADGWSSLVYRATGELDVGRGGVKVPYAPIGNRVSCPDRAPLSFDEISPSQSHRDGFSIQATSQSESLFSQQPFELSAPPGFGRQPGRGPTASTAMTATAGAASSIPNSKQGFVLPNGVEFGYDVFDHLRRCIEKLLELDADWLFRLDNGCDEDLIAGVAAREKTLMESQFSEAVNVYSNGSRSWQMLTRSATDLDGHGSGACKPLVPTVPHCGGTCVWGADLIISFGVWCVHRVLELSLMESRPELWGKYTYVLNRLQGILEPAFTKTRTVMRPCMCLQGYQAVSKEARRSRESESSYPYPWSWGRNTTNPNGRPPPANLYLEMIKEVEAAVSARKGRSGTAAGDIAFPKGKENLASVLKRYKRRLGNCNNSNKSGSAGTSNTSRRPVPSS